MTILIALAPGQKDDAALRLGLVLARSSMQEVLVASVVPAPWPPSPYGADKEFLDYQEGLATRALERARARIGGSPLGADYVMQHGESVAGALLEVIGEREISVVVLGSSSAGMLGRVMLGGVAERIMHGADVPVVVAPRGYEEGSATRISRITVAFGRADNDSGLLARTVAVARDNAVPLRVVCFVVRPMAAMVGGVEASTEQLVVSEWMKGVEKDIAATVASVAQTSGAGEDTALATRVETVLGQGSSWSEAVHDVAWGPDDLLLVGTSSGPLSRFFLGSHAAKIVRSSSVPVMLLPRG